MREFWNKAKKELKVGFNSTVKAIGIKKDEEDEAYLARVEKFDRIVKEFTALRDGYKQWTKRTREAVVATEPIYGYLKEPSEELVTARPIIEKWTGPELEKRILTPLQQLGLRIADIDMIKSRRWRKRELMQASSGEELEKWTNSYNKYNDAFIEGVDQLAGIYERIRAYVVQSHRWILQEMTKELRVFAATRLGEGGLQAAQPVAEV